MYKNGRIQDYANSNPGQLVQKLIFAKYCTRQIYYVYSIFFHCTDVQLFFKLWLVLFTIVDYTNKKLDISAKFKGHMESILFSIWQCNRRVRFINENNIHILLAESLC